MHCSEIFAAKQNTINIQRLIHIIHEIKDQEVPYQLSLNLINKIQTPTNSVAILKLMKHHCLILIV